jgi:hypothetical protein
MKASILAPLGAILLLAACGTPYTGEIKTATDSCHAGNQGDCSRLNSLLNADAAFRSERAARIDRGLAVMAVGLAAGAEAYAASRPVYVRPPVYVAPAPMPMTCTSMGMGPGMVSTNCW